MITFKHKGNLSKTSKYFDGLLKLDYQQLFKKYAELGKSELERATPVKTGLTASSWDYRIETTKSGTRIVWTNSNVVNGANIAMIIQYGHATPTGGYVEGIDYINPTLKPIFNDILIALRKEVKSL